MGDVVNGSVYHWEWDCRVILGLGDTPSAGEVEEAYKKLSTFVTTVLSTSLTTVRSAHMLNLVPSKTAQADLSRIRRELQRTQDAYEHLKFLVRTGEELPPVPDWARRLGDDGLLGKTDASPPHSTGTRKRPKLKRYASSTTVGSPGFGPSRPKPVSERVSPGAFAKYQRQPHALRTKKSSRKLRRTSSMASSGKSRTSLGSQVSDNSISPVEESLEAMKDVLETAKRLLNRRKMSIILSFSGSRSRQIETRMGATNAALLEMVTTLLNRITQYRRELKESSVSSEREHQQLVQLYDAMRREFKVVGGLDPAGAESLLAKLKEEDYVGRLDAIGTIYGNW